LEEIEQLGEKNEKKTATLGVGAMESRISRRLIDKGADIVIYNRNRNACAETPLLSTAPGVFEKAVKAGLGAGNISAVAKLYST
jgi:3-hydroxyisobutyrate dehydrogenase-like beta-hydroxyacid dehydrogenase